MSSIFVTSKPANNAKSPNKDIEQIFCAIFIIKPEQKIKLGGKLSFLVFSIPFEWISYIRVSRLVKIVSFSVTIIGIFNFFRYFIFVEHVKKKKLIVVTFSPF